MRTDVVFTLTGADRVGIVEDVTANLLDLDGNVETSRMARLGGEFAILMLVSLPPDRVKEVEPAFEDMVEEGYSVAVRETGRAYAETHAGWLPYRIDVSGADHEGIIHEIAQGLSRRGINIESAETWTTPAPTSGTPLFRMTALVVVPPDLPGPDWIAEVTEAGHVANVDVDVSAVGSP